MTKLEKWWEGQETFRTQDLADELGISKQHVSEVVRGKTPVSVKLAPKLEEITGIARMELLYPGAIFDSEGQETPA